MLIARTIIAPSKTSSSAIVSLSAHQRRSGRTEVNLCPDDLPVEAVDQLYCAVYGPSLEASVCVLQEGAMILT